MKPASGKFVDESKVESNRLMDEDERENARRCSTFTFIISIPGIILNAITGCLWRICQYIHMCFDIQTAQLYEYTVAHILDKNFESSMGFL
jgi:hypothetical protein